MSKSGRSLSIDYAMKKKGQKMADGGTVNIDPDKAKQFVKGFTSVRAHDDACPSCGYSKGGDVKSEDNDLVDRIMAKKMSKGGVTSNEETMCADELPNEFDDLVLDDNLESDYGDDDNSGDSLGNAQEDEDRSDIVSKILSSRRKKDRNPRPA